MQATQSVISGCNPGWHTCCRNNSNMKLNASFLLIDGTCWISISNHPIRFCHAQVIFSERDDSWWYYWMVRDDEAYGICLDSQTHWWSKTSGIHFCSNTGYTSLVRHAASTTSFFSVTRRLVQPYKFPIPRGAPVQKWV